MDEHKSCLTAKTLAADADVPHFCFSLKWNLQTSKFLPIPAAAAASDIKCDPVRIGGPLDQN